MLKGGERDRLEVLCSDHTVLQGCGLDSMTLAYVNQTRSQGPQLQRGNIQYEPEEWRHKLIWEDSSSQEAEARRGNGAGLQVSTYDGQ